MASPALCRLLADALGFGAQRSAPAATGCAWDHASYLGARFRSHVGRDPPVRAAIRRGKTRCLSRLCLASRFDPGVGTPESGRSRVPRFDTDLLGGRRGRDRGSVRRCCARGSCPRRGGAERTHHRCAPGSNTPTWDERNPEELGQPHLSPQGGRPRQRGGQLPFPMRAEQGRGDTSSLGCSRAASRERQHDQTHRATIPANAAWRSRTGDRLVRRRHRRAVDRTMR